MYNLPIHILVPHGGDRIPVELNLRTSLTQKILFQDSVPFTRD